MKNIIIIITLILSQLYLSQDYPLDYKDDVPNGAYYKDTYNELNKYVGVWKANWNGKTLYLDLRKLKHKLGNNSDYVYRDMIMGERKIINSNGTVEIDRISNFGSDGTEFNGIGKSIKPAGRDRLFFYPRNMCRKQATLDITSFTGNQMTLHFEYLPSAIDENCVHNAYIDQHGDFPINFPKDITLTKQ